MNLSFKKNSGVPDRFCVFLRSALWLFFRVGFCVFGFLGVFLHLFLFGFFNASSFSLRALWGI